MGDYMKHFIGMLLCGLMLGCGGGGGSSSGCSVLDAKIFNGDTCNQSARTPVVAVVSYATNGQPLTLCTGVLVTTHSIVTAAHCFVEPEEQYGILTRFDAVVGGASSPEHIPLTAISVHPLYDGIAGSPVDVAMATLSSLPNPLIGPVPLVVSVATQVGDTVSSFGYGTDNQGVMGILKAADFQIEAITPEGNLEATLETANASICQGDSGGPLLKEINGVPGLVGLNSFGVASQQQCSSEGSVISGFVDLQFPTVINFIRQYSPDVSGV